jgi:trans-aconitate methyltransferase
MANMACRAAVLMYVLQHDMLFDVLLIAFATGACMASQMWSWMCAGVEMDPGQREAPADN